MKSITVGYLMIICGVALFAMCIYFDHTRHQDPNFRKKLRDRRKKLKKQHLPQYEIMPKQISPEYRETMIINEIQIAERLMAEERLDDALFHFAQAISVCADPAHLLNCLKKTLPKNSFDSLLHVLTSKFGKTIKQKKATTNDQKKHYSDISASLNF